MRGVVDQLAVQHGGDFVDAVGEQEAAVEDRDLGLGQGHERTVDVSDLFQASSPEGSEAIAADLIGKLLTRDKPSRHSGALRGPIPEFEIPGSMLRIAPE